MRDVQLDPIAIVGIGCRFPGADNPHEFWKLLTEGKSGIREVPANRWNVDELYDPDPMQPGKMVSRWGGFLDQIDQFDWRTFRISPREAKYIDPQHRLLLEVAWEALEDAGLPLTQIAGSQTSVAIGIGWSDYLRVQSRNWSQLDGYTPTGNASCFAANRLSYIFDLKGPSVSLDAGCSSSLAAVYYACQSLWTGDASLALAGGVNVMVSPDGTIMVSKAGLLSPDGRCKTLDASADGFVRGEGAGVVVLKRLADLHPTDRVYALIDGVAINHNGHNEWIIATSQAAQEALLREAYRKAGVNPADVDYVELHGTGFQLGDAVETKALGAVIGASAERKHACMIGSVKTNIGHLEAAAGIASIIKVALSLYHQQIPPILNLQTINSDIALEDWQLAVPRTTCPWPEKQGIAYAGVTTLAFTGANAHAVLSAFPRQAEKVSDEHAYESLHLLPVSARSKEALYAQAATLRDFLRAEAAGTTTSWSDVCYTASVRRTHHRHRLTIRAHSPQEAAAALDALLQRQWQQQNTQSGRSRKLAFMLAHQIPVDAVGNYQFLYRQAAFRTVVDECDQLFRRYLGRSVKDEIRALPTSPSKKVSLSPSVCFTLQMALAALWRSWGIMPDAILGEGFGEIAAASIAGMLTTDIAVQLIARAMRQEFTQVELVRTNEQAASEKDKLQDKRGAIPLYSASEGLLTDPQILIEMPWQELASVPDLSIASIDQMLADNYGVFVDLGSPSALSGAVFARLCDRDQVGTLVSSMRQGHESFSVLLESLGILYTQGYTVEWSALYGDKARCTSLPTYAWQRERLWLEGFDVETISTPPERFFAPSDAIATEHEEAQASENEPAAHLLSRPLRSQSEYTTTYVAPRNEMEQVLVAIWQEIFGIDRIGVHDSFYELGGNSLQATKLVLRISEVFQLRLSPAYILELRTIANIAECIDEIIVKKVEEMSEEEIQNLVDDRFYA